MRTTSGIAAIAVTFIVNASIRIAKDHGYDISPFQDQITDFLGAGLGLALTVYTLWAHKTTKAEQKATTVAVAQESQTASLNAGNNTPPLASSILQQQPIISQRINTQLGK